MTFAVARQAGWLTDQASAEHAKIGLVTGPDGKRLKTRTGEQVKLIDLINEAVERAGRVIADRYDDPEQRDQIAEAVGIGALKYGDLSVARESSYTFDFDRMLTLTGNTGPYLQYATARIRSIFRKAGLDPAAAAGPIRITEDGERALALSLLGFGRSVHLAAQTADFTGVSSVLRWMQARGLARTSVDIVGQDEFEYDFLIRLGSEREWIVFGLT